MSSRPTPRVCAVTPIPWSRVGATRTKRAARVFAACALIAVACTPSGPRDIGNQHPRSEFVDGPGSARARDAGARTGESAAPAPSSTGQPPRQIAMASARAIVTSATHVYFGDAEDGAVLALPKATAGAAIVGEPTRLARRAPMPNALAIDPTTATLAWIASPGDAVLRVSARGGTPSTVRDRGLFTDVAVSGDDIFITEAQGTGGVVIRVTGHTTARLGAVEGTPRGLAVDAQNVFVATSSRIVVMPRVRGASIAELARGAGFASPVLDDTWLYVTAVDPARSRARVVVRVKKSGGPLETIASGVRDAPIAIHSGALYWLDAERHTLLSARVASGGLGEPHVVSEDAALDSVSAFTVDDDGVFLAAGHGENAQILHVTSQR